MTPMEPRQSWSSLLSFLIQSCHQYSTILKTCGCFYGKCCKVVLFGSILTVINKYNVGPTEPEKCLLALAAQMPHSLSASSTMSYML